MSLNDLSVGFSLYTSIYVNTETMSVTLLGQTNKNADFTKSGLSEIIALNKAEAIDLPEFIILYLHKQVLHIS